MTKANLQPPAIFLMGPTASGKTDLAYEISRHYPVEVISVDSALVYRGMDIGTAKPDAEFLQKLPHHLVDVCDPDCVYSAAQFRRDALALMEQICQRGRIPLLVGGTMLYYRILLEGIASIPSIPVAVRDEILLEASEKGWPKMHEQLAQFDSESAARIHPNHSQRIQRAIEVYRATGESLSQFHARQEKSCLPYRVLQLALDCERRVLHERINMRFAQMLESGFVDEVIELRNKFKLHQDLPSMRAVGYRQVWQLLEGEVNQSQMLEMGCAATRQLAKRQLTWLRGWANLERIPVDYSLSANIAPKKKDWSVEMTLIRSLCDRLNISPDGKCV